jgi:hypothetical protein
MDFDDYLNGTIDQAWNQCFKVWREAGRVEDFPHGQRRPMYSPSLGKRLGSRFAELHYTNPDLVIRKLFSSDSIEVICAYDILELMAWEYYSWSLPLPDKLLNIDISIPEPAISEIRGDHFFRDFQGVAIGEFLPFLLQHG